MAFVKADRIKENSITTGAGALVLAGATSADFRTFASVMSNGDTCQVLILNTDASGEWEICEATYVSASNSLTRSEFISSSTGSTITFSSGTKNISMLPPASKMLVEDNAGNSSVVSDFDVGGDLTVAGTINGGGLILLVSENVSYTIGSSVGKDFASPAAFMAFMQSYRIASGYTVTASIESGTYTNNGAIIGHPDGARIIFTNDGMNLPAATTGASGTGATATVTFSGTYVFPVGHTVVISGMTPSGYNGSHTVTSSSAGSVSFSSATTGVQTVAGTVNITMNSLNTTWVIDSVLGIDATSRTTAQTAAELMMRAKYKVIIEQSTSGTLYKINNLHSGDWSSAPSLFINTGSADTGVSTGSGASVGDGPGGVGLFSYCCFFGFTNACLEGDYGGVINANYGYLMFGGDSCARTDFSGGTIYALYSNIVGGGNYGYRCNHGGSAYLSDVIIRGCSTGLEATNSPGMWWAHNGDIQYNYIGTSAQFGGSGKLVNASVKNNARSQISIGQDGAIDARALDSVSTATFAENGVPAQLPLYGIVMSVGGTVNASGIVPSFRASEITGTQRDIYATGVGVISVADCTYGSATTAGGNLSLNAISDLLTVPQTGRTDYETVEIAAGVLTVPESNPRTIGVVQPGGSAGTAITITSIDNTNLPIGESFTLIAENANSGEVVTVNDSSTLALRAPSRYLSNLRDTLVLAKVNSSTTTMELSYSPNHNGNAGDHRRARVATAAGAASMTRTDNILVMNKVANETTAISLDSALNYEGSDVTVIDGKGDAATYNLTITPGGGQTINGAATYVISKNYGSVRLINTGTAWLTEADEGSWSGSYTGTFTGDVSATKVTETYTAPTISGGTLTINLNNGTVFNVANNANITTFTISNATASKATSFTLVLTADGSGYTQAWGASVVWASGSAPTLTTTNNKRDILTFLTNDGGTTWFASVYGQAF